MADAVRTWARPLPWGGVIAPLVTVVAGALILVAGLLGHSQSPTVTSLRTAWGTVVGFEEVPHHGTTPTEYHAVVRYRPPANATPIMFTDPDATQTAPLIGSRVRVDYQPKHPTNAHVISKLYDWVPWVVSALGVAAIVYGGLGLLGWARRRSRGGDPGASGALLPRGGESP
jgi:hypothetical protein